MTRRGAVIAGAFLVALVSASPASADTHQASIGNYYFEENEQLDRKKIVVDAGDQVTFTVVEGVFPPHTVEVDDLKIHSGDILLGQSYTTPPLTEPGNYFLYCRPHEDRGHHTRLIVRAAARGGSSPTSKPAPDERARSGSTSGDSSEPKIAGNEATPSVSAKPSDSPTLAPVGISKADPSALERPLRADPDSLESLTGRSIDNTVPWTRALWQLALAAVAIAGIGVFAYLRARAREAS